MTPPRASNQVSFWAIGCWTLGPIIYEGSQYAAAYGASVSVDVVDQAILKMMEKGDE